MDPSVAEFLKNAGEVLGHTPDEILREVFKTSGVTKHPEFVARFMPRCTQVTPLIDHLDREIRLRNPGLHYTFRQEYFGFRRERLGPTADSAIGERSRLFLSIVPRVTKILVYVPVDPTLYTENYRVRDVSNQGHQGVGRAEISIVDIPAATAFLQDFQKWLVLE